MAGIKKFFRNLFGLDNSASDKIVCIKMSDGYYACRKVQNSYDPFDGPFTTCEQCKASCGATECREE